MSEVHRYQVVTMLSASGATIGYDPHGPDVVMASAFDEATRLFLDAAERCVAAERRENELQQRLTAADERIDELTKPQGEQMACMPVERCYDVRAKMIIAFNEAKKTGGDLDDALDAAYKSALRYSPHPLIAAHPASVAVAKIDYGSLDAAQRLALCRGEQPVAVDVLSTGFYTTESGGGKYAINIGFRSMADMQGADAQLRELLKSR